MSVKKEIKVWLHGRRRMLFDRLKKKRDVTNASLLRDIIDYYFENNPNIKE
jgi:hypothetical protein